MCDLETLLIEKTDFDCIGQIAKHCDWNQLCIYIREQQNLYLLPKIGFCLLNKIQNNLTDELIKKILCGSEFTDCNGNKKYHFGLKRVLVHASYAAYIYRHGFVDTPFGVVQKINQDSLPTPLNELKGIKNEHYNNAEMYYSVFKEYLETIKEEAMVKECLESTCNSSIQENDTQRRQFTFSNIEK